MKFYIAAGFEKREIIKGMYQTIRENGHEITSDWTDHLRVYPYAENSRLAEEYSSADIQGASSCDIFVLLSEGARRGASSELGVAINNHLIKGKPEIYVIGKDNTGLMFYFHPSVNRRNNLKEVLEEVKKSDPKGI